MVEKQERGNQNERDKQGRQSIFSVIGKTHAKGIALLKDAINLTLHSGENGKNDGTLSLRNYDKLLEDAKGFHDAFDALSGTNGTLRQLETNTTHAISSINGALKFIQSSIRGEFTKEAFEQGMKSFIESMDSLNDLMQSDAFHAEPGIRGVMDAYSKNTHDLFVYSMNHGLSMRESYPLMEAVLESWMQSMCLLSQGLEYWGSKLLWMDGVIRNIEGQLENGISAISNANMHDALSEEHQDPVHLSKSNEDEDLISPVIHLAITFGNYATEIAANLSEGHVDYESLAEFMIHANTFYDKAAVLAPKINTLLPKLHFLEDTVTSILEDISVAAPSASKRELFSRRLGAIEKMLHDTELGVKIQTTKKTAGESLTELLDKLKLSYDYDELYTRLTSHDTAGKARNDVAKSYLTSMLTETNEYTTTLEIYLRVLNVAKSTLTDLSERLLLRRDD